MMKVGWGLGGKKGFGLTEKGMELLIKRKIIQPHIHKLTTLIGKPYMKSPVLYTQL